MRILTGKSQYKLAEMLLSQMSNRNFKQISLFKKQNSFYCYIKIIKLASFDAKLGFITMHIFVLSRVWIPRTHLLRVLETFSVDYTTK